MNNPKSCESAYIEANEIPKVWEYLEWGDFKSVDRKHVNVLLNISEEQSFKEQDPCESLTQIGWEEAIQGWVRCAPLACLFQAQRKGRKAKPEVMESHCLLCADLKDLKLSELFVSDSAGVSSESSCEIAEEPLKNIIPTSPEHLKRSPSISSCASSLEEETFDVSIQEKNVKLDPLENKPIFEQCLHNKAVQPNAQCQFLKDRHAGKVAVISSLIVLPPVKPSTHANSRSPNIFTRRETPVEGETNSTVVCEPVFIGEKVGDEDKEKAVVVPYCSSAVDTCQGSLTSKHRPIQQQYLLSFPVNKKALMPFSTLGDTLPRATPILGRNLKQDELVRTPLRHNSGHRNHLNFKAKSIRRAEPELPMLLGTKVPIPVSSHRLL